MWDRDGGYRRADDSRAASVMALPLDSGGRRIAEGNIIEYRDAIGWHQGRVDGIGLGCVFVRWYTEDMRGFKRLKSRRCTVVSDGSEEPRW